MLCGTKFSGLVPKRYVRWALRGAGMVLLGVVVAVSVSQYSKRNGGALSNNLHQMGFSIDGALAAARPSDERDDVFVGDVGDQDNDRRESSLLEAPGARKVLTDSRRNAEDGGANHKKRKGRRSKKKAMVATVAQVDAAALQANSKYQPLDISVNEEYHVNGLYRPEDDEAFLPFTFVRKYFDVYGGVKTKGAGDGVRNGGVPRFQLLHSYGKPFSPPKSYRHRAAGPFINFGGFNVAGRERVLYVDECNVPVSVQWDPKGYHYATQISQYGLQHYSAMVAPKNQTTVKWLVNGKQPRGIIPGAWKVDDLLGNKIAAVEDQQLGQSVLEFCLKSAAGNLLSGTGFTYSLHGGVKHVFLATLQLTGDALGISFQIKMTDNNLYTLHYDTTATKTLDATSQSIRYRMTAERGKWKAFARDLQNDIQRAVLSQVRGSESLNKAKRDAIGSRIKIMQIKSVTLFGCGRIANLSLRSDAHQQMAMDAADWLLENQDKQTGGWPTNATRTLKPSLVLNPGWLSAMVQGQAMSMLVRAYYASKNKMYLEAAMKATLPFHKTAKDGGVRAVFLKEYIWYEEYPTQPSSFVLNGFIFALLGLHDLDEAVQEAGLKSDAGPLYRDGVRSLKALAMLYDTGVGTIYDLRHFSIPTFPPNRARWDYHVTHINLMTAMQTIDDHPIFGALRERWLGYMSGHATKHN